MEVNGILIKLISGALSNTQPGIHHYTTIFSVWNESENFSILLGDILDDCVMFEWRAW